MIVKLLRNEKQILYGIILISVILRLGAAIFLGDQVVDLPGTSDQISYNALALRVMSGHGFSFGENWWPATAANAPTAHWSYLYTFFLVLVYAIFGPHPLAARILQAILVGVLQPLLVYQVARQIFGSTVGLISALLTAVYAYFVYYAACLMTESFYICAILSALYLTMQIGMPETGEPAGRSSSRKWYLGLYLGMCLGAAVLLRQLILLLIPFFFLWICIARRWQWGKLVGELLPTVLVIIVMILPFTAYNYARFHRIVLLNTNSGFAFFWGNHPIYGTHFISILPEEMGTYHDLIPPELRNLDEAALDQALLGRGLGFVLADPGRYVLLSFSRIPAYFMFWPSAGSGTVSNLSRVLSFGLFLPFMLLGLIRALIKPRLRLSSPIFLLALFIVVYTLIHLMTWALVRYRLPVDALLVIFAGLAIDDIRKYLASRGIFSKAKLIPPEPVRQ
jgi:4-amino-4-deoxy-L-arabinose transferase-like glycosyltransferase